MYKNKQYDVIFLFDSDYGGNKVHLKILISRLTFL